MAANLSLQRSSFKSLLSLLHATAHLKGIISRMPHAHTKSFTKSFSHHHSTPSWYRSLIATGADEPTTLPNCLSLGECWRLLGCHSHKKHGRLGTPAFEKREMYVKERGAKAHQSTTYEKQGNKVKMNKVTERRVSLRFLDAGGALSTISDAHVAQTHQESPPLLRMRASSDLSTQRNRAQSPFGMDMHPRMDPHGWLLVWYVAVLDLVGKSCRHSCDVT